MLKKSVRIWEADNELNFPQWDSQGFPNKTCCCCEFQSGFDDDANENLESIEVYKYRWISEGGKVVNATQSSMR